MYECTCKSIEPLDMIKRTTFDQNQCMTSYLIYDFRPTYFSYFQKISANSNSHNVKKQVDQYGSITVVKGLKNYKENTASRRDFEKIRSAHFSSKSLSLPSRLTTKIYNITFYCIKIMHSFASFIIFFSFKFVLFTPLLRWSEALIRIKTNLAKKKSPIGIKQVRLWTND